MKDYAFNKINQILKSYKRIKIEYIYLFILSKLALNSNMTRDVLVGYLKLFTYKNKLNVKINESGDYVEVFDENFDDKITVNELKISYQNVYIITYYLDS